MMRRQLLSSKVFSPTNVRHVITTCMTNHEAQIHGNANQFSENADIYDGNHDQTTDALQHNYINTTKFQRLILSVGSSVAALINPQR